LKIAGAQLQDAGAYECFATNGIGEARSRAYLNIIGMFVHFILSLILCKSFNDWTLLYIQILIK